MGLAFTYDDLRIRTAEYMGVATHGSGGTGAAALPTDAHDLDVVSRVVNEGYQKFILESDWEFLRPLAAITFVAQTDGAVTTAGSGTFVDSSRTEDTRDFDDFIINVTRSDGSFFTATILTFVTGGTFTFADASLAFVVGDTYSIADVSAVAGQNYRYFMPTDFYGVLVRAITYREASDTPALILEERSEDTIRAARSGSTNTTGDPVVYAIRLAPAASVSDEPRWEIILWPTPISLRTIEFIYERYPAALVTGTDRPITGFQHNLVLLAACKSEAEIERFDKAGPEEDKYQKYLAKAIRIDKKARPKRLGDYGDRSEDRRLGLSFPGRRTGLVDDVGGTSITF